MSSILIFVTAHILNTFQFFDTVLNPGRNVDKRRAYFSTIQTGWYINSSITHTEVRWMKRSSLFSVSLLCSLFSIFSTRLLPDVDNMWNCGLNTSLSSRISRLSLKRVRLAPNGTNLGLFQIRFPYILAQQQSGLYWYQNGTNLWLFQIRFQYILAHRASLVAAIEDWISGTQLTLVYKHVYMF